MTLDCGFGSDDRGVSDVVGYVLIFSLIVATVGVVTTVGFSTLDDRQDAERINNVERAFDVFGNNMENVYRDGAPSRATEMRLAGGTLRHGDPVTVTIEAANGENVTASLEPLIYEDGDTEIVYATGAVIRTDGGSSVMLREPPFRTDTPTALFPIVRTFRTTGATAVSVEGTVRVTTSARSVDTALSDSFIGSEPDTITVESPRSDAWERYFESQPGLDSVTRDAANDTVEATIFADQVAVPRFPIRVRFQN